MTYTSFPRWRLEVSKIAGGDEQDEEEYCSESPHRETHDHRRRQVPAHFGDSSANGTTYYCDIQLPVWIGNFGSNQLLIIVSYNPVHELVKRTIAEGKIGKGESNEYQDMTVAHREQLSPSISNGYWTLSTVRIISAAGTDRKPTPAVLWCTRRATTLIL